MMARATKQRAHERVNDRPMSEEERKALSYAEYARGVPEPLDRVEVALRRVDYLFWRLRHWRRRAK
jgi:hypothetical protein